MAKKSCFVACPIGEIGSDVRKHSEWVLDDVIRHAIEGLGYLVRAGHEIPAPGTITHQVISALWSDELVIADLTFLNPNVFFELALRQAFEKPVILIAKRGTKIPFDVEPSRIIFFDRDDFSSVKLARQALKDYVTAIEQPDYRSTDLVSIIVRDLRQSSRQMPAGQVAASQSNQHGSRPALTKQPSRPTSEREASGRTIGELFEDIKKSMDVDIRKDRSSNT